MKYLVILMVVLSTACEKEEFTKIPAFPIEGIRTIAVCPAAIQPELDADGYPINLNQILLGNLVAEEFIKFQNKKGIAIMYPRSVVATMKAENITLKNKSDIKQLGRLLNVDAICLMQINQFSDFSPKRCTLTFFLYETKTQNNIVHQIVNIGGAGSKFALEEDDPDAIAIRPLAMIQRQWDASSEITRKKAKSWSNRLEHSEEAKWQSILEIKDEFFRMIFHYTIREYVEAYSKLQQRKAKPGKHTFVDESRLGSGLIE